MGYRVSREDELSLPETGLFIILISEIQEEIAAICRRYRVKRPVEYQPPFLLGLHKHRVRLQDDLQAVLKRKVDLVRKGTIDNPYLLRSIEEACETNHEA